MKINVIESCDTVSSKCRICALRQSKTMDRNGALSIAERRGETADVYVQGKESHLVKPNKQSEGSFGFDTEKKMHEMKPNVKNPQTGCTDVLSICGFERD